MPSGEFAHIRFDEKRHRYFAGDTELTAVTTWLKQFQKPFDAEATAQRMANKPGETRTAAQIRAAWDRKGQASRELGTQVHAYIAKILKGKDNGSDPYLALSSHPVEMDAFDNAWNRMKAFTQPRQVEWVIGHEGLGLAGTVDCVGYNIDNESYHLFDWKTGKFETNNQWGKTLLPPFDDLPDCQLSVYSLQLSAYRLILEQTLTYLPLGDSYIVHLSSTGAHIHKALDLRSRIRETIVENE